MKNSNFTRRHYETVANVLQRFAGDDNHVQLVNDFCDMFSGDNSRFNKDRFIEACTPSFKIVK